MDLDNIQIDSVTIRNMRKRENYMQISAETFKQKFRMKKSSFIELCNLLRNCIQPNKTPHPLTIEEKLIFSLRFYLTNCLQNVNGDCTHIHKSCVCKVIQQITDGICSLLSDYVQLPESLTEVKQMFYEIAAFPSVIGCIGGTHIKIQKPSNNSQLQCWKFV